MKRISVVGTGYVGLVVGTCMADFGRQVICLDKNESIISDLNKGVVPIFEPGLEDIIERNLYYKRLEFTADSAYAIENAEVIFVAVGTPPLEDGDVDLQYVFAVADEIGQLMNGYKTVVMKSTVPVGTAGLIRQRIEKQLELRGVAYGFDVVSNPEFLREGAAVYDFTHPDRIVLGVENDRALRVMEDVYRVLFLNDTPFEITDNETAEMIKYASNAFLAVKISYINEIANLCDRAGADVHKVAKAMGRDGRISPKFLHPGPGYGGSCFPKDTKALARLGRALGSPVHLIEQAIVSNENQIVKMVDKVLSAVGDLKEKKIALLGLTFKPKTDDIREAPALAIMERLIEAGALMRVFDPEGMQNTMKRYGHLDMAITYCQNEYEACEGADALIIATEWHQFRYMDLPRIKSHMDGNYFFDFRNVYERREVENLGFEYHCVGRPKGS
jgi:UDPglucose 6-dehydrogenase